MRITDTIVVPDGPPTICSMELLIPTEMGKLCKPMDSSPLVVEVIWLQVWENHPEKSLIDLGILPWKIPFCLFRFERSFTGKFPTVPLTE